MANVASNVLVGKPATTGGALYADLGTTLPTDATTALPGGFTAFGYVSEDGLTQSTSIDSNPIKEWGGDTVRVVQTGHTVTFAFQPIESNDVSLANYYSQANYSTGTALIKSGDHPRKIFVFEIADGTSKMRIVIPNGQITDQGDVAYKSDSPATGQLTITAYPDASGVKAYIYTSGVPAGAGTSAPLVTAASPTGTSTAGGALITLTGANFTGATSVKFGGTNATNYVVVEDSKIVATAPAKTAGSQVITVVNATGTSNSLAFTYS